MYLNNHLYNKNYGMAGALSVILFIITGLLSLLVYRMIGGTGDDSYGKPAKSARKAKRR